jgi:F420H(2)-dependent quinone reductase
VLSTSGKRLVLWGVSVLVSAAAALAIGILLFGHFGRTESRILGTTALLAGYSLLALPAAVLHDQRRLRVLADTVVALAVASASLAVSAMWMGEPPVAHGKAIGSATGCLVATVQVAALAARDPRRDPRSVRRLFVLSSILAAILATMLSVAIWTEIDREGFARLFGALVVLDVLLVVLQPILARARPVGSRYAVRLAIEPDETIELTVEAPDRATAASRAIRELERAGRRVRRLEFADRSARRGEVVTPPNRNRARHGSLNTFVNPMVRLLLRSPFHRLLSSSLAVISYTGTRTGRRRSLPVMYARRNGRVVVVAGHPEQKRWWRNLRLPTPVEVYLAGRVYRGRGRVVVDPREVEEALGVYRARFPRTAHSSDASSGAVVVIELTGEHEEKTAWQA